MSIESFALAAAFSALLGTPIVSPIAARYVSRLPERARSVTAASLALLVTLTALACMFGVSTPVYALDVIFLCVGYFALSTALLLGFKFHRRLLGLTIGTVGVLLLAAGVLAGTIGAIAVMFLVGDSVPLYEGSMPGYRCYVMPYGNATTSVNGYEVILKRQAPMLPVLEHVSSTSRFDDPSYDLVPAELCQRALRGEAG